MSSCGRLAVLLVAAILVLAACGPVPETVVAPGEAPEASPVEPAVPSVPAEPGSPPSAGRGPATDEAPDMLRTGARGADVVDLQHRLADLGLDPGPADGHFGPATLQAVYTVQALHGLAMDGVVGPLTRAALEAPADLEPLRPELGHTRVVNDLGRQLLFGYRDGELVLVTHVSSGKASTPTPVGSFRFIRRIAGWRTSPLGVLYNPLYFHGGYAVHGAPEVPPYAASHGCVRLPMHIAEYFPSLFADGDPVAIIRG